MFASNPVFLNNGSYTCIEKCIIKNETFRALILSTFQMSFLSYIWLSAAPHPYLSCPSLCCIFTYEKHMNILHLQTFKISKWSVKKKIKNASAKCMYSLQYKLHHLRNAVQNIKIFPKNSHK